MTNYWHTKNAIGKHFPPYCPILQLLACKHAENAFAIGKHLPPYCPILQLLACKHTVNAHTIGKHAYSKTSTKELKIILNIVLRNSWVKLIVYSLPTNASKSPLYSSLISWSNSGCNPYPPWSVNKLMPFLAEAVLMYQLFSPRSSLKKQESLRALISDPRKSLRCDSPQVSAHEEGANIAQNSVAWSVKKGHTRSARYPDGAAKMKFFLPFHCAYEAPKASQNSDENWTLYIYMIIYIPAGQ